MIRATRTWNLRRGTAWLLLVGMLLGMAGGASAANNGTAVGTVTYTAGQTNFGQSLSLSNGTTGGTNYVSVPEAPIDVTAGMTWTIQGYFYPTDAVSGQYRVIACAGNSSAQEWFIATYGGVPTFYVNGFSSPAKTTAVTLNAWHHFALVVQNGTSATLYVDGAVFQSTTGTYAVPTGAMAGYIGGFPANTVYWNGQLDDISFSRTAVYTAAFTPPAAPISSSLAGQTALYHFEGNLNDSNTYVPAPAIAAPVLTSSTTTSNALTIPAASGSTSPYTYNLYRSPLFGFTPGPSSLVGAVSPGSYTDSGLSPASTNFYALTVTDSQAAPATSASAYTEATTLPVQAYNIRFAGNSLTAGNDSSAGNDYPSVCLRLLGPAYGAVPAAGVKSSCNMGISGQVTATIPNPNPNNQTSLVATAPTVDAQLSGSLKNILVVWEQTNEIFSNPASIFAPQAEANFAAYCQARRAAGWKVIVLTVLPRQQQPAARGDDEAVRQAVNAWDRANWPTFADGLADVAADSRLGYPGAELNSAYYYLGGPSPDISVHLVDAGYSIVASSVAQAVSRLNAAAPVVIATRQPSRGR